MREPIARFDDDQRWCLGVDPGFSGALAAVGGIEVFVFDTPILVTGRKQRGGKVKAKREYDLDGVVALLRRFPPASVAHVGLELVASRPDQGVSSMFAFGQGFGMWEMGLKFAGFKYTRVPPQKWQRAMLEGVGPEHDGAILRAKQLFPRVSFEGVRGGARDGRADAILIAEYVRRQVAQGLL